jgi:glucose/arabinose dehydrogenase
VWAEAGFKEQLSEPILRFGATNLTIRPYNRVRRARPVMFERSALAVGFGVLLLAAAVPGAAQGPVGSRTEAGPDAGLLMIGSGLGSITSIANAGDSRLFITLRTGRIVVWDGRGLLPRAFLDISKRVSTVGGRGLFSVAFHPRYVTNGFFFVGYTDSSGNLAIARYKRSATNGNRADPASGVVLLTIPLPADADHSGGELQFGPDGYLYVGVGDGGSGEDSSFNAQRDDVLLGKILRLNVNRNVARSPFYRVPPSNPFARAGTPLDKVWARGLRDPRRFSFDRLTGDLYIGDVGQTAREEIDFQERASRGGENYGWRVMEGSLCTGGASSGWPAGVPPCKSPDLRLPILEYGHEAGDCAVVGGYVYRGSRIPGLSGVYFYGDSCTGRVWGGGRPLGAGAPGLSTFGEDSAGELYAGTETGMLYRMVTSQEAIPLEATVPNPRPMPPAEIPLPPIFPSPSWAGTGSGQSSEPQPPPAPAEPPPQYEAPYEAPPDEASAAEPPPPAAPPAPAPGPDRLPPEPVPRGLPPPRTVTPH